MNRILTNALAAIDRQALVLMLHRADYADLLDQPGVRAMLRQSSNDKRHPALFHGVPVCVHDDRQAGSWAMCVGTPQPTLWKL